MDIVTLSHLLNEMNLESYNIVSGGKTYKTLADYLEMTHRNPWIPRRVRRLRMRVMENMVL